VSDPEKAIAYYLFSHSFDSPAARIIAEIITRVSNEYLPNLVGAQVLVSIKRRIEVHPAPRRLAMNIKTILDLLKETFAEWNKDKASRLAAALAYYTVFSLRRC